MKRTLAAAGTLAAVLTLAGCSSGALGSSPPVTVTAPATAAPTSSSSAPAAAAATPTPAYTPPPAPAPTTPHVSVRARVQAWWPTVSDDFQAVDDDYGAVQNDADASDVTALTGDCATMIDDARTMLADPPAPDAELAGDIRNAMQLTVTAGNQCVAGEYASSAGTIQAAARYIGAASTRVQALT